MTDRKNYLKLLEETSSDIYPKCVKVMDFAVGQRGEKLHQFPSDIDIVAVVSENIEESGAIFEVYCRGMLWGKQKPSETWWETYRQLASANHFTIKLAATNQSKPIRMNGDVFRISYGNIMPMNISGVSSFWYTSHIGFSCFGYDERYVDGIFRMPKIIDAVFLKDEDMDDTFSALGDLFNDISKIYRELVRNVNYLGNIHYLLTGDVNKYLYLESMNMKHYKLEHFFALLDECITGLFALLFESDKKKNINLPNLVTKIVDAKFGYLNKSSNGENKIDTALDKTIQKIIEEAKKQKCFTHLARHRNQRIAHFGMKFFASEKHPSDAILYIQPDYSSLIFTSGWQEFLDEIGTHLKYCHHAICYIEECLITIVEGCEIFGLRPVREYQDIESFPRQNAVWDLYDALPKEKFDIPWVNKNIAIPS